MSEHGLTIADLDGMNIDDFDSAEYLSSEQAVAAYLTAALETSDASTIAAAVGNVARARGMAEIAKASGLAREGLYKALRPNSQPRLETIMRVIGALGVRLVAEVIPTAGRFAAANLPKVAALPGKPARRTAAQAVLANVKTPLIIKGNAKVVANKMPAKLLGKPMAKPAAAKPAAKAPAARPASKREAASPAAKRPLAKSAAKRAA